MPEQALFLQHGFLPECDPLPRLSPAFDDWEEVAAQLPKLLVSDRLRPTLEALPPFPLEALAEPARERAMTLLSCLGHAYVWHGDEVAHALPARLAQPWHAVATSLGLPPVLTYSSYVLHNYRRFDASRAIELGNLCLIQNFLGGQDEEWFVLIHVDIEHRAAPAIAALHRALDAADAGDADLLEQQLRVVHASIDAMNESLHRMAQGCDPHTYFNRVRPYLNGWKGPAALPAGLVYKGVDAYGGRPQRLRGPTGAQSAVLPALDAMLGIALPAHDLRTYLAELRTYMPASQRAFLASLEARVCVRGFVERAERSSLSQHYNACVDGVERFRSLHLELAAAYVWKHLPADAQAIGTGGTSFMTHLKANRDDTERHRVTIPAGITRA